jgi:predicted dehydrogenase
MANRNGIELHGDLGSIFLSDWQNFDAAVELAPFGEPYRVVPVESPFPGTDWGRALDDLSGAIGSGRPQRATGAHAAHIVEILDAITASFADGSTVAVTSSFARPELGSNGAAPT